MPENPQSPGMENNPSMQEQDAQQMMRDLWMGIIGSIVGNLALLGLIVLVSYLGGKALSGASNNAIANVIIPVIIWALYILPWPLNIIVIILAMIKRRYGIVLGMLASYALAFVLVLIAGVIFTMYCFSQYSQL
jgi:hypothetical protein